MITLLRREFIVNRPVETAWQYLARIDKWPSWARHIKQIEMQPPGALGPKSTGLIHLRNGVKPAFTVTEFNPYRNWKWVGKFLWATVHYDHLFEEQNSTQTKFTWIVEASGFGVSVIGRLFGMIYKKDLDRAIPLLVAEINASVDRDETAFGAAGLA
jgi:hypothetical protein